MKKSCGMVAFAGFLRRCFKGSRGCILAGWVLVCAVCLTGIQIYFQTQEATLKAEINQRQLAAAAAVEQMLLRSLDAAEELHALLQLRHELLNDGNAEGTASVEAHLAALARTGRFGALQVAAVGADGVITWSSVAGRVGVSVAETQHFRAPRDGHQGLYVGLPVQCCGWSRLTLPVTRSLRDQHGNFAGLTLVSLDPVALSEDLVRASRMDEVIAIRHWPGTELLARSVGLPVALGTALLRDDPLAQLLQTQAEGTVFRPGMVSGRTLATTFRRVQGQPLVVIVGHPWEPARQRLALLHDWILTALGVLLLMALAAILLAMQRRETARTRAALALAEADRTATEKAWAELERLLSAAPAALYSGEMVCDIVECPEPRLRFVSANATAITGWPPEALLPPGSFSALIDPADLGKRMRFREELTMRRRARMEYRLRRPDGSWCWIREEAHVTGGTPEGGAEVFGYLSDVTAQRQVEVQTIAAAKLSTLGEMAAAMAHELNQPLAVISLAADNAALALEHQGGEGIPATLETLEVVAQQAVRAKDIVQHLRRFSRPGGDIAIRPVALKAALDGALLLTRGALRDAHIALKVDIPANLPAVTADLVGMEQVLVNLLLNARDAMQDKPPAMPRRVTVQAAAAANEVLVTVSDTGGGIPAEVLPRIFEPFFTTKDAEKGTGLGLSICQGTMKAFGGSIAVANDAEGAVFTLRFRAAPAVAQPSVPA